MVIKTEKDMETMLDKSLLIVRASSMDFAMIFMPLYCDPLVILSNEYKKMEEAYSKLSDNVKNCLDAESPDNVLLVKNTEAFLKTLTALEDYTLRTSSDENKEKFITTIKKLKDISKDIISEE